MFFTPLLQGGVDSSSSIISVDSTSNSAAGGGNTRTWTHYPSNTPSSVVLAGSNDDYLVTSASYGGVALTKVAGTGIRGVGCVFTSTSTLPAGPQTVSVTFAGPSNSYLVLIAVLNSKVTNPVRRFNTKISTTANADSINITVPAGDLGICFAGMSNLSGSGISPSDGKPVTIKLNDTTGTYALGPVSNFAWSAPSAATFSMMALSIQPAVGGGDGRNLVCVNNISKRTKQPQGIGRVDWSNPITRGLIRLVGDTSQGEAITGNPITKNGTVTYTKGSGYTFGASASSASLVDAPANNYTVFSLAYAYSASGFITIASRTGGATASPISYPQNYNLDFLAGVTPRATHKNLVGGAYPTITSSISATAGTLCAAAGTFDGSTIKVYTNGVLGGSVAATTPYQSFSPAVTQIGANDGIDKIRPYRGRGILVTAIWNRALSGAEIKSISENPYQLFKAATKPIYVAAKSLTKRFTPVLRRVKRKTQPQTPTKIDWSNPITAGLVAAINPAAPDPQLIRVGTPTYVPTPYGVALKNPNDTTVNGLTQTVKTLNSAATIVYYGTMPSQSTAFIVGGFGNNGSGDQLFCFQSGNISGPQIVRTVIRTVTGGNINTAETTTFPAEWATIPSVWTGVYDGTANLTLYRNGVDVTSLRINTAAFGSISTLDNFSLGLLNRGTDVSSGPNTQNLLALGFNRALSPREVYELSKNPWQIFKAVDKPIYLTSVLRPRSFVKVKTKPQNTQPQVIPKLRSRYATWEWVYVPSMGLKNLGSKNINGVFTGSAGYDGSSKAGKAYTLGSTTTSTLRLGDTTCKFIQTKPVSGLIVFKTVTTTGNEQALFIASANSGGLYIKRNGSGNIEIDCATSVLMLAGSGGEVKAGDINVVAFCIEPRIADGGTGRVAYALNGKLVTGTWTGTPNFTSPSQFGVQVSGEAATHQQMLSCATTASITNAELVKLSKNPWSIFKGQNASLYLENPPATIVTNGLVIHLDAANPRSYSGSGTTWTDLSGNNNTGTLVSGPSYSSNNSGSIVFDGIDDHVQITGNASNTPASMTLFCFIYPENTRPEEIIATQNTGNGYRFMTKIYGGDNPSNRWGFRPSSFGTEYQSPTSLSNNAWYCLAVTYTPSSISGYVNGVLDWTAPNPDVLVHGGGIQLGDGIGGAQRHFQGKLPVFMMYNRALSPQEVLQNYNVLAPRYPNAAVTPTTLFAALFSGVNTLYTHTVSSLYTLLAGLYTNSSTLYSNTISSTRVLLADLYNNVGELYDHTVDIWQNSVINYLSNLRTKVVTATTKAITAISTTRTKVIEAGIKTLSVLSATRTKLFSPTAKSVSLVSDSRTKVFTPETKSKTFTTTTRG